MRAFLVATLGIVLLVGGTAPARGQPEPLPTLRISAPDTLSAVSARVEQFPTTRLATAMTLAGLRDPGGPIDVYLSPEDSDLARSTPPWISGFADAGRSLVVLFPARANGYPSNSLESLLHHEVAHVLFSRAARGHTVPRWFNEGLAMAAERPIALSDRTRLAWTLVRHGSPSLAELERLFSDDRAANQRGYAVANALVRDLLRVHGQNSAARVLSLIGQGQGFDDAFVDATGEPITHALDRFWSHQRLWGRWLPFLTGPAFLWAMITILALFAIGANRRRRAAQRRVWDEEETTDAERAVRERLLKGEPGGTVH